MPRQTYDLIEDEMWSDEHNKYVYIERREYRFLGPRCYVNVYSTNRAYGGPEEGGWWYNCGEALRSIRVPLKYVERVRERVQAAADRYNKGDYPPGSVLCSGWISVRVERAPAEDYPQERPYFS